MEYSGSGEVWAKVGCSRSRPKINRCDGNNGSGGGVAGGGEGGGGGQGKGRWFVVEAEAESNCLVCSGEKVEIELGGW